MSHFPKLLQKLPPFEGSFEALKLEAKNCDVLFASYPKGTKIAPHKHDTENVGVYHLPAEVMHSARFDVETSEIEFWFRAAPR